MIIFIFVAFLFNKEPIGKVTYIQETKLDGIFYKKTLDGETYTYFNSSESVYFHAGPPDVGTPLIGEGGLPILRNGDKEGFPIYKGNGGMVYTTPVFGKTNCIIHDTIPRIDWEIQPDETRQIGKYTCRKAVGVFGGRVYDAWFTPEIPVPHGPYKLGGLPGLILEAHSRDGKVSFHFQSFEWTDKPDREIVPPTEKIVLSSPSELPKTIEEYHRKYEDLGNTIFPGKVTIGPRPTDGDRHIEKNNTP